MPKQATTKTRISEIRAGCAIVALTLALLYTLSAGMCSSSRVVTDTFCVSYQPIRASRNDTAETLRQIKGQNAVYDALCKGVAPSVSPLK